MDRLLALGINITTGAVAKPARQLGHAMQIFLCRLP